MTLLEAAADPNKGEGLSPLHVAADNGHLQVVRSLVQGKASIKGASGTSESNLQTCIWNSETAPNEQRDAQKRRRGGWKSPLSRGNALSGMHSPVEMPFRSLRFAFNLGFASRFEAHPHSTPQCSRVTSRCAVACWSSVRSRAHGWMA